MTGDHPCAICSAPGACIPFDDGISAEPVWLCDSCHAAHETTFDPSLPSRPSLPVDPAPARGETLRAPRAGD